MVWSVYEAVGDGGCSGRVVEQLAPVLEGQVGGDDGRCALIALVEDLVEQVGTTSVEAEVSELVDEKRIEGGPGSDLPPLSWTMWPSLFVGWGYAATVCRPLRRRNPRPEPAHSRRYARSKRGAFSRSFPP